MKNEFKKLTEWFQIQCDGEWENENQIVIQTSDNPGWIVEIDLDNTTLENIDFQMETIEKSDEDWYFYEFNKGKFFAAGDLNKLNFLLSKFIEHIE